MALAYFRRQRARPVIRQADAARDRREWATAANHYCRALEIIPERSDLWVQYGNMLKESGAREDAGRAYDRALAIDPRGADTHLQLGHLRKLQGDPEAAAASYARALELDHGSHAAGELARMGREADASRILARAVSDGRHPLPDALAEADRIAELEVRVGAIAGQISTFLEHVSTTRALALELARLKTAVTENGERFARLDRAIDALEATLRRHGVAMSEINGRQTQDAEAAAKVEMRLVQQAEALSDIAGALAHQTSALAKVGARLEQKSEARADIGARSRSL